MAAVLSQLNKAARCAPKRSIRKRNSGLSNKSRMEVTRSRWEQGSKRMAAESATSGIAEVLEQATARPHAMASRIGNPKPS